MATNKAKKVETFYGKYSNIVVYEYRGCTYEVEYSNALNYCCSPAWVQHKSAQEKIDTALDNPKAESEVDPIDWDEIWDLMEWN